MKFAQSKEGIFVSQQKYMVDLLDETSILEYKPTETPTKPNVKLHLSKSKDAKDRERYQKLLGRLFTYPIHVLT